MLNVSKILNRFTNIRFIFPMRSNDISLFNAILA
jgi:hypothetical protein